MLYWSRFDARAAANQAQWPMWEKLAALSGVALAAMALIIMSYVNGRLTLGWEALGLVWTIVHADQPASLIAVIAILEAVLLFLFYMLLRAFFFVRVNAVDHKSEVERSKH